MGDHDDRDVETLWQPQAGEAMFTFPILLKKSKAMLPFGSNLPIFPQKREAFDPVLRPSALASQRRTRGPMHVYAADQRYAGAKLKSSNYSSAVRDKAVRNYRQARPFDASSQGVETTVKDPVFEFQKARP